MDKLKVLFGAFLGVILFISFTQSAEAWSWSEEEIEKETLSVKFAREVLRGGYSIVTTGELKSWLDQNKPMLIVDTMPYEASYKKNHIPGAVQFLFPIEEMDEMDQEARDKFQKLLGPDKERVIVMYCGFTKCSRSHNAAMWAVKLGYQNVYRCPGGIKAWMEADYPVEEEK